MSHPTAAQSPTPGRRGRRWLLACVSVALTLGALELVARVAYVSGRADTYARADALMQDWPDREAFLRDRQGAFGREGSAYHDWWLAGPPTLATETVNYRGDRFGSRLCPDSVPIEQATERVWFFGGSTMENLTTTDAGTLANRAVKAMNDAGFATYGDNFGFRTFATTLEVIKFEDLLRRMPVQEHPSVVVFYDGYNDGWHSWDSGPGNLPPKHTLALQLAVERRHTEELRLALGSWLADVSMLARQTLVRVLVPRPVWPPVLEPTPENLERATDVYYLRNKAMAAAICEEFGCLPLFVLQPLLTTKAQPSAEELEILAEEEVTGRPAFLRAFYRRLLERTAGDPRQLDMTRALDAPGPDGGPRWDYYDLGHTGPATSLILGDALGAVVTGAVTAARAPGGGS